MMVNNYDGLNGNGQLNETLIKDVVAVIQRNLQLRSRERNEFLEFLELEGTGTLLRFQGKLSQLLAEEELMLAKAGSPAFLMLEDL
ncbi:hypothetical protein HPP92_016748 [Vanilla planifolia]|uniref:Uncharacterized protein n=1 Tax=Vanilla planifolia TaxID=51239 RepID=A0A835QNT6_VANPL|nr:hypothetical protein HPP92_016748 [Vanilla planifolia]